MTKDLREIKQDWEQNKLAKMLSRSPERKPDFTTSSAIPLDRIYLPDTPSEAQADGYLDDLGQPGEFPYTRGVQPTMYRGRFWTMRQYAGYAQRKIERRIVICWSRDKPGYRGVRSADADWL